MNYSIGFIGTGKMGYAISSRAASKLLSSCRGIYAYDTDKSKTDMLAKETGIEIASSLTELLKKSDIVFIALIPSVIRRAFKGYEKLFENKIIVSIAAGVDIVTLKDIFGDNTKIFRTMPNRPALTGKGVTIISYLENEVNEEEKNAVVEIFRTTGETEILDESLMNEVIALTGSSPAYVFMLIEAMANAAVLNGIPAKTAYRLASLAVEGSAAMVNMTGSHPAVLKDEICTPAGTTIEAVRSLEESGFRSAVIEAMNRCTQKAVDIGRKA